MALIYRSIFEVEDLEGTFPSRAPMLVQSWLRYKLDDPTIEIPENEALTFDAHSIEIESKSVSAEECQVSRFSVYEGGRDDGAEVKTTLTAIAEGGVSWAWIDLERWTSNHGRAGWIPAPPGLVVTILMKERARRGALEISRRHASVSGAQGSLVTDLLLDASRQLPIVVVSHSKSTGEGLVKAEERGRELARRLAGVASVFVLGDGAVGTFSKSIHEAVGPRMDVHSGAIRTYLPGVGALDDHPGRHRFVAHQKLDGRPASFATILIAPSLLRRVIEIPPPAIWRSTARALLLGREPDSDYDELLQLLDDENAELRSSVANLGDELVLEREENTEQQRRNDNLGRQVRYLRDRLRALEPAAPTDEPLTDTFEPVLCIETLEEARQRFSFLEIPEAVDEGAVALDAHGDPSWARRAWSALRALDRYAEMKSDDQFDGSFLTYCESSAGEFVIPAGWVVPTESASTRENRQFRAQRTLPISSRVDSSEAIYMQEHIRIEKGSTPSPRIHYYDDTRGTTGRIHIGWFGDHLDSRAKS